MSFCGLIIHVSPLYFPYNMGLPCLSRIYKSAIYIYLFISILRLTEVRFWRFWRSLWQKVERLRQNRWITHKIVWHVSFVTRPNLRRQKLWNIGIKHKLYTRSKDSQNRARDKSFYPQFCLFMSQNGKTAWNGAQQSEGIKNEVLVTSTAPKKALVGEPRSH